MSTLIDLANHAVAIGRTATTMICYGATAAVAPAPYRWVGSVPGHALHGRVLRPFAVPSFASLGVPHKTPDLHPFSI